MAKKGLSFLRAIQNFNGNGHNDKKNAELNFFMIAFFIYLF